MSADRTHFVYRAYDSRERPLYVGCTGNLSQRYANHRATSAWFQYATDLKMAGPFEKADAFAREKALILELRPTFNALPEHALMVRRRAKRLTEVTDRLRVEVGIVTREQHWAALQSNSEELRRVWDMAEAIVDSEFDLRCYQLGRIKFYERLLESEAAA